MTTQATPPEERLLRWTASGITAAFFTLMFALAALFMAQLDLWQAGIVLTGMWLWLTIFLAGRS